MKILSPRQSISQINIKRRVCLWWGVLLVLVIDPYAATFIAYDAEHPDGQPFARSDTYVKKWINGTTLTLTLPKIFAILDEPDSSRISPDWAYMR